MSSQDLNVNGSWNQIVQVIGEANVNFSSPRETLPTTLPALAANFAGRDSEMQLVVADIKKALAENRVVTVLIEGIGGVGKSAFAVAVAHECRDLFPGGAILIKLNAHSANPVSPAEARRRWLSLAIDGIDDRLKRDDEVSALYIDTLVRLAKGLPCIVVVDDAKEAADSNIFTPPKGIILCTSRSTIPADYQIRLGALSFEASAVLLTNIAPRCAPYAQEIAGLCKYLPIALKAAASFLATRKSKPVEEYIDELKGGRLKRLSASKVIDASLDVINILAYSLQSLDDVQAAALADLTIIDGDFTRNAAMTVAACPGDIVDVLVSLNLLEVTEQSGRLSFHDLIRELVALDRSPSLDATQKYVKFYVAAADAVIGDFLRGGLASVQAYALERRHIHAAIRNLQLGVRLDYIRALDGLDALVASIPERKRTISEAIQIAQEARLDEHECDLRKMYGNACADRGHVDLALESYAHAESLLPKIHNSAMRLKQEGDLARNRGIIFRDRAQWQLAWDSFEQSLRVANELDDPVAISNNKGDLATIIMGSGAGRDPFQRHRAILLFNDALQLAVIYGLQRSICSHHMNLGRVLLETDLKEGKRHLEEARKVAELLGDLQTQARIPFNLGSALLSSYADP